MREQYKRHNIFLIICVVIVVMWLGSLMIKAGRTPGDQIRFHEGAYVDCCEGWYDDAGNVYNIENIAFKKDDINKEMVIHYRIPEGVTLQDGDALCFFARGMDFKVYATAPEDSPYYGSEEFGSRTIYEFKQNAANLSGKDIGLTLQVVPINVMDRYNELTMVITPAETSAFILEMRLQKASDAVLKAVRTRLPMFIWSIFIVFMGAAIVIYTMFAADQKREDKTLFYGWGAYTLIFGTLLTIESQFIQILTGRPELFSSIKYAMALLISFPAAVMCDCVTKYPHKRFSNITGVVVVVLFAIEAVGAFFLDLSLYKLFLLSAILILVNSFLSISYLIRELREREKYNRTGMSMFVRIMALVNFFVFTFDLGYYAMANRHMTDWGRIMRVFYVIFLFGMLAFLLRLSIRRNHEAMLAEKYKQESRTDALTGLLNKNAYIRKEAELTGKLLAEREKGNSEFTFAVMSLDLNYLKKVNDTMGHKMGDWYIKSAGQILKDAVGEKGEVYRTGGDEFLTLVFGDDPEAEYNQIVENLLKLVDEFNETEKKDIPLSFAYGHALCTSSQNYSIHDSERIADKEMYECKRRMKAERID